MASMKKTADLVNCTECGARLCAQAEACPECGYPHIPSGDQPRMPARPDTHADTDAGAGNREYRVLQIAGIAVAASGVAAALADFRIAAGIALATGTTAYLMGILGAWWNRSG